MVLEQQITNLEKALREQQLDSMAINSIRQVPQADYQLFKAHVIKMCLIHIFIPKSYPTYFFLR